MLGNNMVNSWSDSNNFGSSTFVVTDFLDFSSSFCAPQHILTICTIVRFPKTYNIRKINTSTWYEPVYHLALLSVRHNKSLQFCKFSANHKPDYRHAISNGEVATDTLSDAWHNNLFYGINPSLEPLMNADSTWSPASDTVLSKLKVPKRLAQGKEPLLYALLHY